MQDALKNKLIDYQVTPPPGVWDKISQQLDEEHLPSDHTLSSRMEQAEAAPPPGLWSSIAATLASGQAPAQVSRSRTIPLIYKRLAAAALIAGLLTLPAIYLLRGDRQEAGSGSYQAGIALPEPDADYARPGESATEPASPVPPNISSPATAPSGIAKSATRPRSKRPQYKPADYVAMASFNSPDIQQAEISMLQPAPLLQRVSVKAPLIRDKKGNIIMDLDVIHDPGEPYITVTGPNGHQTRISTKFLSCLSYLNSDEAGNDLYAQPYEAQQCKSRFSEWRDILSEAALVPAASNFFDIFELKAIIEER